MSMVEIHLPQPFFVISNQCVTRRSRLRFLLHFCGQHVQPRCFCIGLANCYFPERGAKRKKGKLNYPVTDKNRKLFSRVAITYLRTGRLGSQQENACLESAATELVDLGKDSNFLGSQNFLRSSNHRVWG